jgi:Zn-dependent protease with chaperone function
VTREVPVAYFDGKVSTRHEATLSFDGSRLTIRAAGVELCFTLQEIVIPPGVGSIRRTIRLPDGGLCVVEDAELLAELERAGGSSAATRAVHRWEKSLTLSLAALLLTTMAAFLFMRYGIPFLANRAAFALPPATERAIGTETLATLDRLLMAPSKLDQKRRDELAALLRRVAGPAPDTTVYRLECRDCPAVGANAFALPSGIIIITDDLVELAKSDDELAAVMAHEVGHSRLRHPLRHLLQSSSAGLIMATLTGDLVSISSLAATLPTLLVETSYSRKFEREADAAAIAWLKSANIPPRRYAEFLARIQAQQSVRRGNAFEQKSRLRNYLSTHPDTEERIRQIVGSGSV